MGPAQYGLCDFRVLRLYLVGGFFFEVSAFPFGANPFGALDRPFSAGKITLALGGLLRIAVEQSVGAGCLAAGTLSTHTRHMPAGGR